MKKIGITGSLASGKSTASKILSFNRGPLFIADEAVKKIYQSKNFMYLIRRKFKIKNNNHIKKSIKKLILENKENVKKLERIIHPLFRKKMTFKTLRLFRFLTKLLEILHEGSFYEYKKNVRSGFLNFCFRSYL